jgi:hypothetical protein
MATQFDPPRYTWHAQTVREALTVLGAVQDLVDAHLKSLEPGDGVSRSDVSRATPISLTVALDLSGLVQAVNDKTEVEHLETVLELPADICWCGREKQPGENHSMCYPGME